MPVRLLRPYEGQAANTLYWASSTIENNLRGTGGADDQIELASDYAPATRIVTAAIAATSRNATVYRMNSATAQTLTLNTSGYWPIGGAVSVFQLGAGTATVTPASGVTINGGTSSVTVASANAAGILRKVGKDAWVTEDGFSSQYSSALAGLGVASERLTKLLRTFEEADQGRNPYQRDVMASPPTITVSATSDGTLAAAVPFLSGGVLSSAAINQIAWYGGLPKLTSNGGKYVALPVASQLPSVLGNLAAFAGTSGITGDMNMWCGAFEIMTDATTIEFGMYGRATRPVQFQIDGQYVSKSGSVGAQAGNADNYFKLVFATSQTRRIRIGIATDANAGQGASIPFQIRTNALSRFWKPDLAQVLKLSWISDSYGEGQGDATYSVPNGPMAQVAGEILGIRDVRQVSVGQTGYVATGGTRSKQFDQIPFWLDPAGALYQGTPDVIVDAAGYNDASFPTQVQAEALACYQRMRALASNTPIVVLGSQNGARVGAGLAQTQAVEAAIQAAVTQFNDPLCKFIPVTADPVPWLYGSGYNGATNGSGNSDVYISSDGIHPSILANGRGHEALGFRAAAAIKTAIKTMIAP